MTINEIRSAVSQSYLRQYPSWTNVVVTEVVEDTFGGALAVVRAATEESPMHEEVCFVYPEGTVRIFFSTEELARFLEQKAKTPLLERIFSRPVLSGMVFLIALIAVIVMGMRDPKADPQALSIIGSLVGVAAGFFFASSQTRS